MEEAQKSETPTELESSAKGDSQPPDENQIESAELGPNTEMSDPDNTAGSKTIAAPVSDSAEAAAIQQLPDADLKDEEKEADAKKPNDHENDNDKMSVGGPPNIEKAQKPAKKIFSAKSAVTALLVVAAFCGFFVFDNKSKLEVIKKEPLEASENSKAQLKNQQKNQSNRPPEASSEFDEKIKEISALRDALLQKQEEILELKRNYLTGIEELEKEISDEMQDEGITSFMQAMKNKRIEFALQTIQCRKLYIQKLEKPLNWIFKACEELLYIKRQAMVDLQVAAIASGIDLDGHMQQMSIAAEKYRLTADKLSIDSIDAQTESLESIWKWINESWLRNTTVQSHSDNHVIAKQICKGEFGRLAELSEISTETAKCISQMQSSDLFLIRLNELTPAAARELSQWNGNWICLNGLRVLSPRVALYLFQWKGNWLSLNGLTDFPAEIGEALLQWNGAQLELMGLQYTEDFPGKIAIEFLARWERFGGKLFVPDMVRKKIDAFNRPSGGA
jgi:hypothetical protein